MHANLSEDSVGLLQAQFGSQTVVRLQTVVRMCGRILLGRTKRPALLGQDFIPVVAGTFCQLVLGRG